MGRRMARRAVTTHEALKTSLNRGASQHDGLTRPQFIQSRRSPRPHQGSTIWRLTSRAILHYQAPAQPPPRRCLSQPPQILPCPGSVKADARQHGTEPPSVVHRRHQGSTIRRLTRRGIPRRQARAQLPPRRRLSLPPQTRRCPKRAGRGDGTQQKRGPPTKEASPAATVALSHAVAATAWQAQSPSQRPPSSRGSASRFLVRCQQCCHWRNSSKRQTRCPRTS